MPRVLNYRHVAELARLLLTGACGRDHSMTAGVLFDLGDQDIANHDLVSHPVGVSLDTNASAALSNRPMMIITSGPPSSR